MSLREDQRLIDNSILSSNSLETNPQDQFQERNLLNDSPSGNWFSSLWFQWRKWIRDTPTHKITFLFTIIGVIFGLFLGIIIGYSSPSVMTIVIIGYPGELLLRSLKSIALFIIPSSIIVGICGLNQSSETFPFQSNTSELQNEKSKKVAKYAIWYFLGTTVLSIILGLFLVAIIHPGSSSLQEIETNNSVGNSTHVQAKRNSSTLDSFLNIGFQLVTDNPFRAFVEYNVLGVIGTSITVGISISSMLDNPQHGHPAGQILDLIVAVKEISEFVMSFLIWLIPLGIASIIASRVAENLEFIGLLFQELGLFTLTVLLALFIHSIIILPSIYCGILMFNNKNPRKRQYSLIEFLKHMKPAFSTGFGTASSSATLPITLECASNAKLDESVSQFVLALGSTLNMNGTSLYEVIAAIFTAQSLGIDLSFIDYISIAITACFASLGAAGLPEAGLITMVLVFTAVDLPLEAIGVLLTVDWLLDRFRTLTNIYGDSIGAKLVDLFIRD